MERRVPVDQAVDERVLDHGMIRRLVTIPTDAPTDAPDPVATLVPTSGLYECPLHRTLFDAAREPCWGCLREIMHSVWQVDTKASLLSVDHVWTTLRDRLNQWVRRD